MSISSLLYDRRVRDAVFQVGAVVVLVGLTVYFINNASENLVKAGIASGFDFLGRGTGIDIPFVLTGYTSADTYLSLLWVGIVNTIVVSLVSMVVATILGFLLGIARLSSNWLLSTVAGAYIEFVRNIPLLFFVLFWYFGVIAALPGPRDSIGVFKVAFLNNRGLTIPVPTEGWSLKIFGLVFLAGLAGQIVVARVSKARRDATGKGLPTWGIGLVLLVLLPVATLIWAVAAVSWDVPALRGFNYRGGFVLVPEFVALFAALSTYTAAFIAEIVRGGILAVAKGQREAASAVGLRPSQTLRLVVLPQAMRVMTPPLTSQYLNVLKNSSFGAAIAFPELVSVYMGSALNNVGQAIEISAIVLGCYLAIGLAVSALMNWYNAKMALVTR